MTKSEWSLMRFGTIRNNTALKQHQHAPALRFRFGTIRNNTALKPHMIFVAEPGGFGTIRNNTALKPDIIMKEVAEKFWNHSKQHSSKTADM